MRTARRSSPSEALFLVVAACGAVLAFWLASSVGGRALDAVWVEGMTKLALWVLPTAVFLWSVERSTTAEALAALGLTGAWQIAATLGLIATLPMAIALLWLPLRPLDFDLLIGSAVLGPFAEEVLFRGFLLRQLVRRAHVSPAVAIVTSALLFGVAHRDIAAALPYTLGGGVLGWMVVRFQSLWPAIAMHGLMNLWWDVARGESTRPAASLDAMSIAQVLSLLLAIGLTLRLTRVAAMPARTALVDATD